MSFPDPVTIRPEDIEPGNLPASVTARRLATADTGRRWEITSTDQNRIRAFSGEASEVGPGGLTVDIHPGGGRSDMYLAGTDMAGLGTGAQIKLSTNALPLAPDADEIELRADIVAFASSGVTGRVLYDVRGRLYNENGSGLGFPYNVVLAQYSNGWAAGAGSRGFWSYLGPDGFVTMGGRASGAAISVATMRLPDTFNTPNGLDHRPKEQLHFICYANGAAVNVRIDVNGDVVQTSGTPTNLSLSNIRFPIF